MSDNAASSLSSNLVSGIASTLVNKALDRVPLTLAAGSASSAASAGSTSSGSTTAGTAAQAKLGKVAHQFEAIFLRQMLSEARKANMGDTLFSSDAMDTFGSMEDSKVADIAAGQDTLGIAKMLEKSLGHRLGLDAPGASNVATSSAATTATATGG